MDLTPRQEEVLDAALALLVERGEAPTMKAVAERASCSKETLYKWFGGRDGLLTATVRRQASQVRAAPVPPGGIDLAGLRSGLAAFARDWLRTIAGQTSIALNRLAVGEAGTDGRALGRIVLENGPLAMRDRLEPLLTAGRAAGLIDFAAVDDAFRLFFGLVIGDIQIRLLLGEPGGLSEATIEQRAAGAAETFLTLHGARMPPVSRGGTTQKRNGG